MIRSNNSKIGIFGGSFDPPHRGHLEISRISIKKLSLDQIYWCVTKKNPFKNESKSSLRSRIQFAKKLIGKNDYIKVKFYEEKIGSNRTVDLIEHLSKEERNEIYFIMGADNLINFHKWYKWKSIIKKCNILVFDRQGYKARSLKSVTFTEANKKNLTFVNFNKVNISSSQLRKV